MVERAGEIYFHPADTSGIESDPAPRAISLDIAGLRHALGGESRVWDEAQCLSLARAAQYRAELLAQLLGMSTRTLERYFKEKCGIGPKRFLHQACLLAAQQRLREGWSVKSTAEEVGYASTSFFIQDFKAHIGCTLAEYARHFAAAYRHDRM